MEIFYKHPQNIYIQLIDGPQISAVFSEYSYGVNAAVACLLAQERTLQRLACQQLYHRSGSAAVFV